MKGIVLLVEVVQVILHSISMLICIEWGVVNSPPQAVHPAQSGVDL